jgi:haloalkane dehalogenase
VIEALRTPDERFENLPGYSFPPLYRNDLPGYEGLRMHYLDEGRRDGPVFLCLHGQPSWSYLYRKMLPVFAEAGRVIAPDLFGFGRSDKPVDDAVYTFDFHRSALLALIETLDLRDVTLVCQDWGGLLGLTLPMAAPQRYSRLIIMNTGFATGDRPLGPGFEAWKAYNRSQPDLDIQALMSRASPVLSEAEAAAYAAPYPDVRYKAGVRRFPELVPDRLDAPGAETSRQAREWWSNAWSGESFMAIGGADPVITPDAMQGVRRYIRNCPEPMIVPEAGHFVQEWGEPIARAALASFAARSP